MGQRRVWEKGPPRRRALFWFGPAVLYLWASQVDKLLHTFSLPASPYPVKPTTYPHTYLRERMIKRMADKFGHLGQPKSQQSRHPAESSSSASSVQSVSVKSSSLGDLHRGSVSTGRTSVSEGSASNKRGEGMDVDIIETIPEVPPPVARVIKRPKGTYRLTDFIIQRTLGTGSFGRVHLGEFTRSGWI